MRAHGDPFAWRKNRGSHVIEEDERSDHAPLRRWQHSPHVELPEAASARLDRELDGVPIDPGIEARKPAGCSRRRFSEGHNVAWYPVACPRCSSRTARRCSRSSIVPRGVSCSGSGCGYRGRARLSFGRRTTTRRARRSPAQPIPRPFMTSAAFRASCMRSAIQPRATQCLPSAASRSSQRRVSRRVSTRAAASIMALGFRCSSCTRPRTWRSCSYPSTAAEIRSTTGTWGALCGRCAMPACS